MVDSVGIERILSEKKDLIRLFLIAAILGFAINGLAGLFVSETHLSNWIILFSCTLLLLISLALLAKDLLSTLVFEEVAHAVVFFDPNANDVLRVESYRFSEALHKTLHAVRAENKAIYADWEKSALMPPREALRPSEEHDSETARESPDYIAIVRMQVEPGEVARPKSIRLLEEAVQFVMLEELSLHPSSYFNDATGRSAVKEYAREDIPTFLLRNRVLNLLSTPIEQREIFLTAYPNNEDRPKGEIYSLWGSDGAVFSRFDLVLPKGTVIRHSEDGNIFIETRRLKLELGVEYTGSSAVISRSFASDYMGVSFDEVSPLKVEVTLRGRVKPLALLTSSGWQYYRWLDSFRVRLKESFDFDTFQKTIHWDVIEPLLFAMQRRYGSAPPMRAKNAAQPGAAGDAPQAARP